MDPNSRILIQILKNGSLFCDVKQHAHYKIVLERSTKDYIDWCVHTESHILPVTNLISESLLPSQVESFLVQLQPGHPQCWSQYHLQEGNA